MSDLELRGPGNEKGKRPVQLICWSQLVGFDGRKRGKSDQDIGACPIDGLETKPDKSASSLESWFL